MSDTIDTTRIGTWTPRVAALGAAEAASLDARAAVSAADLPGGARLPCVLIPSTPSSRNPQT